MKNHNVKPKIIFQQDGASFHYALHVPQYLKKIFDQTDFHLKYYEYATKPRNIEELLNRIRRVIELITWKYFFKASK